MDKHALAVSSGTGPIGRAEDDMTDKSTMPTLSISPSIPTRFDLTMVPVEQLPELAAEMIRALRALAKAWEGEIGRHEAISKIQWKAGATAMAVESSTKADVLRARVAQITSIVGKD
jgi:hypothetical protein